MKHCLPSLFLVRISRLTFLFILIACLTGFATTLPAQGAHFSGAIRIAGGTASEASRNALAAKIGESALPDEIQATHGDFGPVNVGASSASPVAMVFTFDAVVTLGSKAVLTQGAAGLDFTDAGGGTCKANTSYNAGDTCTVNVTFKPRAPGARYGAAELLDGSGKLLAMGYVQGTGVGPLAVFANTTSGAYLPSKQSLLGQIPVFAVAVDGNGDLFFTDGVSQVEEIVSGTSSIKTVAGGFSIPDGLAVDGAGNLFFADSQNNAVKEILRISGYVKTLGSGFNRPVDVAVDGSGNVFVADTNNNAVKEIVAAGGYSTVKTLGSGFKYPEGVTVDGSGNVFVGDTYNNAVKEILATGGYTTVKNLGSGFNAPKGMTVDASGNVFVADFNNWKVKEIVAAGGYTTVNTLSGGFYYPRDAVVDGSGNVFVPDGNGTLLKKLDYADPPSLTFTKTAVGDESSDSPQTVTVSNNGNADLKLPIPAAGRNPSVSSSFTLDSATNCPDLGISSAAGKLAAGTSCDYAVDFIPVAGTDSGSLTLTDNSLNASPAVTQTISLQGTVIGPHLAFTMTPPASLSVGQVPGTVAVSVLDSSGIVMTGSSAAVTLTVTGPNSYAKVYTATAANGVATFSSLASLGTAGSYTYTATDIPDGLTQAVVNESVTLSAPVGYLDGAGDNITGSATVSQADQVRVYGWAADWLDGAPLGNVKVYIDGTLAGTPTLGIARPGVAAAWNNNAFLNSGYRLFYPASSLALGAHKVTVVAIDSNGLSTTFGPRSVTVTAAPPFGHLGRAVDGTTGSSTVSQADSLKVVGWVADAADGAPLSNVTVLVDGVSIGAPTLGIARPDVAAKYGSAYLNSGYRLVSPAASLALGAHKVTVVAVDAGGQSTTFGPLSITVE